MHNIEQIFINGEFVTPHGTERFDLYNPATARVIGQVRLADEVDAEHAIAAAKAAFPAWSQTPRQERIAALKRMHAAVAARHDALLDAVIEEYGAPASRSAWMARYPADVIAQAIEALEAFEFVTTAGAATVQMTPLGVAGLITPWNSDAGFICGKLAAALAAGCTAVIKPSEMSALQTRIVTEALRDAGLPPGVFNIVTGRGDTVGETISRHPDVAKISFTGSTVTGKAILRNAAESVKRVTLELGGKSPTILLDDVDLAQAIPLVVQAGFMNSGQACVAGTRILVPQSRKAEIETALAQAVAAIRGITRQKLARWSVKNSGCGCRAISVKVSTRGQTCWWGAKGVRKARRTAGLCARRCLLMSQIRWRLPGKRSSARCWWRCPLAMKPR